MNVQKRNAIFLIFIILCSLFEPLTVNAESLNAYISAENRFDIKDIKNGINELIETAEAVTPSVSITVFDDKKDIYSVVYGDADMENAIAADENTVYEWGSISKVLVWASAMQLYEQGRLDLNKDIRGYLPDGYLKKLKYDEPITMIDLMNHSAGFLSPYKEMETEDIDGIMPLEEALREIEPAQVYPPGEVTTYSNYGAALAGYVVERVSGMDFADYVNENIFDRLGMEHTAIRPDLSDNVWVAEQRKKTRCYVQIGNGLEPLGECRRYIHIYPAGGACGTVSDLALFAKAFLCDSKDCPLFDNDETLDEMLTPTLYFADGKTPRSCHGLQTESAGVLLLGHGGNTEGFSSLMQFDPDSRTGFVMMINKRGDRTYRGELPDTIYGSLDIAAITADSFNKYDLSGHYIMTGGIFETGCFSIYSFLSDRFHVSEQDGKYIGSSGVVSITQISDHAAIVKLIDGSENLYFIRTDGSGELIGLENPSLDFVKISSFEYYCGCIVLVLMLAGMTFMAVMAVIHFIKLRKFKGQEIYKFKLYETLMGITVIANTVSIILLFDLGLESEIVRIITCVLNAVLSAILLAVNFISIRSKSERGNSCILITESFCSIFIVVGVVYWKLYQFWGF